MQAKFTCVVNHGGAPVPKTGSGTRRLKEDIIISRINLWMTFAKICAGDWIIIMNIIIREPATLFLV